MLFAALLFAQTILVQHTTPFTVGAKPVTVTLDVAKAKSRLLRARNVVVAVKGVTAEKAPGFIAAVYVGEQRVGEVALYARGEPQDFFFDARAAVAKALRGGAKSLPICFRAESGLEGQPARVAAPIHISSVGLVLQAK